MKRWCFGLLAACAIQAEELSYPVVDTGQRLCYDDVSEIRAPEECEDFFGQDAQYDGLRPDYTDNGDGTVTDTRTGLMWLRDPGAKKSWSEAAAGAAACRTGGYSDWRLPSIKELYSLIQFSGTDPRPEDTATEGLVPFIDRSVFAFRYGDPSAQERIIDAQYLSSTRCTGRVMRGGASAFGVNFADGRIKGYGLNDPRTGAEKRFYVLYVRGNPAYGQNRFADNGDGTVTDQATGLMWAKADSGRGVNWQDALRLADELMLAGHDDWRLPNAKELQSIVDYARGTPAIDPVFDITAAEVEGGRTGYPFFWSSTTHVHAQGGSAAVYIAFGEAFGWMPRPGNSGGARELLDVHGAGAQRSDPKAGDPADYPQGRGPQGDAVRILNYVRCVRDAR